MTEKILSINKLKTYFFTEQGVIKAVDEVSFEVNRREIIGLVGESGSGKSVTCLSILRLIPDPGEIVGGEILFNNENMLEKSEKEMREIRGKKISMIFQDPTACLNPVFIIGDQITESIKLHTKNISKLDASKRAIEMLEIVGIPDAPTRYKSYPHQLSGGMKQRVMIAMALSCNPELLIADEPTTNLDVTIQAQILDLMRKLREKFNSSILLITHDMGVVAEMCERVGVMYAGKMMEFAAVEEIFKRPKHPYTVALLESIPGIKITGRLKIIPGSVPELIKIPPGCRFHPRCKYAREICREQIPQFIELEKDHFISCHLYQR